MDWVKDKWFALECVLLTGMAAYIVYRDQRERTEKLRKHKSDRKKRNHNSQKSMPIYRVCITGGPCGGKSSCMKIVRHYFTAKGYTVLCVPQTPTLTVLGGASIDINNMTQAQRLQTQRLMMRIQIQIENYFIRLSNMSFAPTLILYDRGVMDPCAYIVHEEASAIFNEQGWNTIKMRDDRYDMILFLVTAADGAEKFYTISNNLARSEGLELAKLLDSKTMDVYSGHPHFKAIGNTEGETFQQKIDKSIFAIEDFIRPRSVHLLSRRYQVSKISFPENIKHQTLMMRVIFLKVSGQVKEDMLIRRGKQGNYIYLRWARVAEEDTDLENYIEQRISSRDFIAIAGEKADEKLKQLNFERVVFIYQKQQFNIDNIKAGTHNLHILNFQCRKDASSLVKLPNFMEIIKDVTEDPAFELLKICEFNSAQIGK